MCPLNITPAMGTIGRLRIIMAKIDGIIGHHLLRREDGIVIIRLHLCIMTTTAALGTTSSTGAGTVGDGVDASR